MKKGPKHEVGTGGGYLGNRFEWQIYSLILYDEYYYLFIVIHNPLYFVFSICCWRKASGGQDLNSRRRKGHSKRPWKSKLQAQREGIFMYRAWPLPSPKSKEDPPLPSLPPPLVMFSPSRHLLRERNNKTQR